MKERGNRILRILDEYIGALLVKILGALRKRGSIKDTDTLINQIALLKTAGIGDTILLSAIVKDIQEKLPDSSIVLFTGENNHEMGRILGDIYGITVRKIPVKRFFHAVKIIREYDFDVWFDFGQWPRFDALLTYFSKSRIKVGFKTAGQKRHYVYDIVVEHRSDLHEIENFRRIINSVGLGGDNSIEFPVKPSKKDPELVVIHMFPGGTKSYMKEWPEEYWIDFINILTDKGYRVALTGSKGDKKRAQSIAERCKHRDKIKVVAGEMELREVMDLLKKSSLVVSVNTGIMHLASALGSNLIALHGPTSIERWGPLNNNAVSIKSPLKCSPCLNLGFEYGCNVNKCMRAIDIHTVKKAASRFIDI